MSVKGIDIAVVAMLALSALLSITMAQAASPALPGEIQELAEAEQVEVLQAYAGSLRAKLTALESAIEQKRLRIAEVAANYDGDDLETMLGLVKPKVDAAVAGAISMPCDLMLSLQAWTEQRAAMEAAAAEEARRAQEAIEAAEAEEAAIEATL